MNAPMDSRPDVGLQNDQRLGLIEESAGFRRNGLRIAAASEDRDFGAPQNTQTRILERDAIITLKEKIAHTEQRKVGGGEPFQELNSFGDIVDRHRRRI